MVTIITFSGDRQLARKYLPQARRVLGNLTREMNAGLNPLAQLAHPAKKIAPGILVQCSSAYEINKVHIHAEPVGRVKKVEPGRKCFCTGCFAVGFIYEVVDNGTYISYNVEICHKRGGKYSYVLFEGMLPVDAAVYEKGSLVMISLQPTGAMYCCPDIPIEGMDMCIFATVDATAAMPVIVPIAIAKNDLYAMWKWRKLDALS